MLYIYPNGDVVPCNSTIRPKYYIATFIIRFSNSLQELREELREALQKRYNVQKITDQGFYGYQVKLRNESLLDPITVQYHLRHQGIICNVISDRQIGVCSY